MGLGGSGTSGGPDHGRTLGCFHRPKPGVGQGRPEAEPGGILHLCGERTLHRPSDEAGSRT